MPILPLLALTFAALQDSSAPDLPAPVCGPPTTLGPGPSCTPGWLATFGPEGGPTGLNGTVNALAVFDSGSGAELYAAGLFNQVGGLTARFARWDGAGWNPVGGSSLSVVLAMGAFDLGGGSALYVGGNLNGNPVAQHVARWDGLGWSPLGGDVSGDVRALTAFDPGTGPGLYVGGDFLLAGGQPAARVARWDGQSWSALGGGIAAPSSSVFALEVFDDGSGPALYVGGKFASAGGVPVANLARWDGQSWSDVGGGIGQPGLEWAYALEVFDDGSGPALYVGGGFSSAGGAPASNLARWDGQSWSEVGGGTNGLVFALEVFDDGSGPALYAGGDIFQAGGMPASNLARWDGAGWSGHASLALPGGVRELAAAPGGLGPALYVGGLFDTSPAGDSHLARWGCDPPALGTAFCFGDGSGASCPCGNAGGPGEGCANSTGGGATLAAGGSASVSAGDLVLIGAGLPPSQPGLWFQGLARVNGGAGAPFGDGLRCAGQGVVRLQTTPADASGAAATTVDIALTGGVSAGDTRAYQLWYRDPTGSPCSARFNLTNGLELDWLP